MPEFDKKIWLTWTAYATPLKTLEVTADLGLSIRVSMFELRETGDWDLFRRLRRLKSLCLPRATRNQPEAMRFFEETLFPAKFGLSPYKLLFSKPAVRYFYSSYLQNMRVCVCVCVSLSPPHPST